MSVTFAATDATRTETVTLDDGRVLAFPARVHPQEREEPNFSNANARALLALLGLAGEDLLGEATIPEIRRAILAARARFATRAPQLTRTTTVEYGAPRTNADGTVQLHPVRAVWGGLDEAGLAQRLAFLASFVELAAVAGATHITWG